MKLREQAEYEPGKSWLYFERLYRSGYGWRLRLGLTHPLLASNDTVPISTWRGGGMHSIKCPVSKLLFFRPGLSGDLPAFYA